MSHVVRYFCKDPIYMSKKHDCPDCQRELKKVKVSRVVSRDSNEGAEIPRLFSRTMIRSKGIRFRGFFCAGDITYVWKEFECEVCGRHITVEEMKAIEGVADPDPQERSPEELRRLRIRQWIFHKILPIAILLLIAFLRGIDKG